jgi:acyl-coenzyme A thioesterase PaaI-like protein
MGRSVGRALGGVGTCATVQLSVQFLAPAEGRLTARSRRVRVGGRVAFMAADCLRDDGTLVATAHGTWALKR